MPRVLLPPPTPKAMRRTLKGNLVILALCVAGLAWIGWLYLGERAFLASAVRTKGVVTEIERSKDEDGHTSSFPVVTFTDRTENKRIFRSRKVDNGLRVGETLPVVYNPDDPAEAHIDSARVSWFTLTAVTLLDLGFLIPVVRDVRRLLPALREAEAARQSPPTATDS